MLIPRDEKPEKDKEIISYEPFVEERFSFESSDSESLNSFERELK